MPTTAAIMVPLAFKLKQQASNQSSTEEEPECPDQNNWTNPYQPCKPPKNNFSGGMNDFSKEAFLGATKNKYWNPGSQYLYKKSAPQMMFKPFQNNFSQKMVNKVANGIKTAVHYARP
ncbi:MAG: hypothetical protein GY821_15115 [Gammaproteobacteria bacterium]|nr:hypothetical protein [Gammaproteobacteria bacterium]